MRAIHLLPAVLLSALTAGCRMHSPERSAFLRTYADQHAVELKEFQREQDALIARTPMPMTLDLGEAGQLMIRELYLIGRPDKAWLRADFTYLNDTPVALGQASVVLVVSDPKTGVEASATRELDMPIGFALQPGMALQAQIKLQKLTPLQLLFSRLTRTTDAVRSMR